MIDLTQKHRPRSLEDFAGLDVAKTIMNKLAREPWESAWLFVGDSGTGKTTMALTLAELMGAELHHIPSRQCKLETVQSIVERCHYVPLGGGWHVVLVDEADRMSHPAQLAFLSALDETGRPPKTIFIFTANETKLLEQRFLSRCRQIPFSGQDMVESAVSLLMRVWEKEAGRSEGAPDFRLLFEQANFNVRGALMALELELMCPGAGVRKRSEQPKRSELQEWPDHIPNSDEEIDAYAAATILGINVATLYNRIKMKRAPGPDRRGKKMLWKRTTIEAYRRR